jgi:hypothetical protein
MRNVMLGRLGKTFAAACLAFCSASALKAQNVPRPDCIIDVTLTAAAQTAGGVGTCGNNINGVYEWRLNYKSTGFTALSVVVQSAPDNAGAPGTWVTFAGTVVGSNPNTATTQASSNFVGFYPWVRVLLSSVTGTGTITGQLYGCRQPGCSISGATITAIVAIPNPLPVDGPTAAGAAPTTPPVLVAGQDGAPGLIRTIKTDSVGELIPSNTSNADADGVSNTQATPTGAAGGVLYPRVFGRVFNGTTWDRMAGNTTGVALSNASTADADGVSNTQATVTNAAAAILYARIFGRVFNGTTWDRMPGNTSGVAPTNASTADSDAVSNTEATQTAVGGGILYSRVFNRVFNGTTWDRARGNTSGAAPSNASSADADAVSNTELTPTDAAGVVLYPRIFPRVYNGTTWDRARGNTSGAAPSNASSAGADAISNTNISPTDSAAAILYNRNLPLGFNGTAFDRLRTAALANLTPATTLTARNSIGAPLGGERGSRFTVVSVPAAGTVASASIASEASVRHVLDHVCFSAQATGAVAATAVSIVVRDGATGAGTVILHFTAAVPVAAGTGQQEVAAFCSPAMDLAGTTATAMTAEFNTGVTNLVESVTLTGYNVN